MSKLYPVTLRADQGIKMNSKSLKINKHVKLDCWITENATINDYQVKVCAMVCHAKISPTQKWSPGLIFAAKTGLPRPLWLPKMVPSC